MPLSPTLLWAQRKDRLIISIDLQDCKDPKVELQNADGHGRLIFKGLAHSHAVGPEEHDYSLDLVFFGAIDADDVKISQTARKILLVVPKKEEGFWPRLLEAAGKPAPNIKVDWDRWVDEDDDEEEVDDKLGGFDLSQLQNFQNFAGGMGGMPGMGGDMGGLGGLGGMGGDFGAMGEGDDSDDDDLPELEKP